MAKEVEVPEIDPIPAEPEVAGVVVESPEVFAVRKAAEKAALPVLDIDNPAHGNLTYEELPTAE